MKLTAYKPVPFHPPREAVGMTDRLCPTLRERDAAETNRGKKQGLPSISQPLLRWFTRYSRRYVRKHFHTVRISGAGLPQDLEGWPLVVYSNHSSWWDPLLGLILRERFFPNRDTFAPMESRMLRRYGFFRWLGFFAVEQLTRRGAVQFLSTAQAVLASPNHLLAITPQGRFADVRERPVHFASGLGHLVSRVERACFLPLAIEYVFWEERLPEVLVRFGPATKVCGRDLLPASSARWTALFEKNLQETQEALAAQAQRRCSADFVEILRGGAGQGGVYDVWRWLKAQCRGQKFDKEHTNK